MTELMKRLVDAGYPKEEFFHHYSDLYIFATPLAACNRTVVRGAWMAEGLDVPHLPGPDYRQADVRLRVSVCGGGLTWRHCTGRS